MGQDHGMALQAMAEQILEDGGTVRVWAPGLEGTVVTHISLSADEMLCVAEVKHANGGRHWFATADLAAIRVGEDLV